MKTVQFYKYATFILLALNITLISFFFITKPKGNMGKPPLRALETLGLDKAQHDLFLASAKRHSTEMEGINEAQKKLLMPYFNQLTNTKQTINSDSIFREVQQLERRKIEQTYQHFSEIKATLKDEQIDDFEGFMDRILQRILLTQKKSPPPPKD